MVRNRAAKYQNRDVLRYRDRHNKQEVLSKTWNQLVTEFTQLSGVLNYEGYSSGDNIGIFSSNNSEWAVADLAILNIRAVVVPFFATASREQCRYIVEETEMKLIFVGDRPQLEIVTWLLENESTIQKVVVFNDRLELPDDRFIRYSDFINQTVDRPGELEKIQAEATPPDLATIIYTSGTTGEPKGVMLNHGNFLYTFPNHQKRLDLTDSDISMAFLPLSHIFERTWTLLLYYIGATNFILDNPKEVMEAFPMANPHVMCVVPRFYEKTYEGIMAEKNRWPAAKQKIFDWAVGVGEKVSSYRKDSHNIPAFLKIKHAIAEKLVFNKLRSIFGTNIRTTPCSGAKLPDHLLRFFHAAGIFVNYGYGATETTATVSCFKKDAFEFHSVGTVLEGVEVKIGKNDEIMVRGKTVFSGYYKKPEETDKVLVDGWYKTGDEGGLTENGNLVMTDRIRDLMKTSVGKYVSPQKIETIVGQHSLIEQMIVVGDNRKFVSALIVPEKEKLKDLATVYKLEYPSHELMNHAKVMEHFRIQIDELQVDLPEHEKIKRFTLIQEPFSIENNMLTSTLKTKRRVIEKRYAELIDRMY